MQRAGARLIFLVTLFLTASVAWMPVDASMNVTLLVGGPPTKPSQPIPGPQAPDGGNPFPTCPPSGCTSLAPR